MKIIRLFLLLFSTLQTLYATNLRISNEELGSSNTIAKYRMITFDISWKNSWRTSSSSNNWDAAWIFIKYKVGNGNWQHATLSTVKGEHIYPAGTAIDTSPDGKGIFIYRSENGKGTFSVSGESLRWNYGKDNVADDAVIAIKVLALEMVYIPQGSFFAGDNSGSGASFRKGYNDNRAWNITSEKEINVTNTVSNGYYYKSSRELIDLVYNAGEDLSGSTFTIPAEFPKGYRAIYCMKYELSQQQYVDFLNLLTPAQATNRYDANNYNKWGYTILNSNGVFSTINPDRACGYFNPQDGMAYADWCGLRPMSELEFEKICRGSGNLPVEGEFAWGTTTAVNVTSVPDYQTSVINVKNSNANCYYEDEGENNPIPMLVGIFERENGSRELTGASFYRVMEMSGNLDENCIGVGNKYGRAFTYRNGDGQLNSEGYTDEANWPGKDGRGSGYRGGCLGQEDHVMQVADRFEASVEINSTHRHIPWGFRAVRTCMDTVLGLSITATAGNGGSIFPSGIVPAEANSSQVFTISPNPGYNIASVIVDGEFLGSVNSYTFDNITSNHDITACFISQSGTSTNEMTINDYVLYQNYPNPFNPFTKIKYELIKNENVSLKVFNISGQEVKTIVNEFKSAGSHYAYWDGTKNNGQKVSSGIYTYVLKCSDFVQSKKMVYIK